MSELTDFQRKISAFFPEMDIRFEEPLAKHTSFRIGGNAQAMAFPRTGEELAALLASLAESRLAPRGFTRAISYETGQWLWRFRLVHTEGEQWVEDAHFALRSDGMLYRVWPGYGYWAHRLQDADMDALNALLQAQWEAAV